MLHSDNIVKVKWSWIIVFVTREFHVSSEVWAVFVCILCFFATDFR